MTRVVRFGLSQSRSLTVLAVVAVLAIPIGTGARQSSSQTPPAGAPDRIPDQADVTRDWSDDIPAHVAVVDGSATLDRDGRAEVLTTNIALLAGDRVRTDHGRVDILFADGSALDLDQTTSVEFLTDQMLRVGAGRIRVTLARATPDGYRIDSAGTTSFLLAAGEYRLSVNNSRAGAPEVSLTVARGSAELSTASGRTLVRAGMAARATADSDPSLPYTVAVSSWEPFDRWADEQHYARLGTESTKYLPDDLRYYSGDLDRNGSWGYVAPYGYVWYPTVAVGWQPYYSGGWSFYAGFGWMWGGGASWYWPTHHYGRWGYSTSWYWIPDHHWGPAWVSWGGAPGYVGWCPLGYYNRPAFSYAGGFATGRGWAVAPVHAFGAPGVRAAPVDGRAIAPGAASRFAQGRAPAQPVGMSARANGGPVRAPSAVSRAHARSGIAAPQVNSTATREFSTRDLSSREGPSRFPAARDQNQNQSPSARDMAPRSTGSAWSSSTATSRSRADVGTTAGTAPGASRIAAPRDNTTAPGTRTWTPVAPRSAGTTARTPSRTVDQTNRYVSQPPYRTEGTPGASSMPRPAQSRSGYAGTGGYQRPSASPAPAEAYSPSRTYSPPSGGAWRSVSPATRPGGDSGSAPSRIPSARPSPGGPGGSGGSVNRPSMSGPSSGAMPRSSGGPGGPSGGGARGGAPSGGASAQSRGGRG